MRHPIPREALDDRLGFIGTSGSGKTYNAGTAVEILLSNKHRVVIIDPLGVWWGLRLCADGKQPSVFDIAIFGGPHGDLPLTENAGALIGETAIGMKESCIIDLSELKTRSAERRFMVAFLETIFRKAGGEPFHLVVDEADLFAPQKPQKGDEVLLGHMENIVRRGRVKGFIPWIISQRPAVVNKNVLSQVDGLLAFKLTSVQDRDALDSWIEGQADKAVGREIKASLPALEIGKGVVWLPGHHILRTADFPKKATFDSSRRLKRGEKSKAKALKPLNLDALKERLAAVEKEAKADNPKALRADIAKLQAEKAALEKQVAAARNGAPKVDPDAIKKAEERGFEQAKKKLENASKRALIKAKREALTILAKNTAEWAKITGEAIKAFDTEEAALAIEFVPSAPSPVSRVTAPPRPAPRVAPRTPVPAEPAAPIGDGNLTPVMHRILDTVTELEVLCRAAPPRTLVALMAGYSNSRSKGFSNALGSLSSQGYITYPAPGSISATETGRAIGRGSDAVTAEAIQQRAKEIFGPKCGQILTEVIEAYPHSIDRSDLGQRTGYENVRSKGFSNALGRLSGAGFITYPSPGQVAAADVLFPVAA